MILVGKTIFGLLCGEEKNPGSWPFAYLKNGSIEEVTFNGKRLIDITSEKNHTFLLSWASKKPKCYEALNEIIETKKVPTPSALRLKLQGKDDVNQITTVTETPLISNPPSTNKVKTSTAPLVNNNDLIDKNNDLDSIKLVSLKDYKDYYDAKNKREIWELKKIEKAKMLGEMIPTDISVDALSVFGSTMQKIFIEKTKSWILDVGHRAKLSSEEIAKMRGEMIDIVNDGFDKSIQVAKKQLKDGIDGALRSIDLNNNDNGEDDE